LDFVAVESELDVEVAAEKKIHGSYGFVSDISYYHPDSVYFDNNSWVVEVVVVEAAVVIETLGLVLQSAHIPQTYHSHTPFAADMDHSASKILYHHLHSLVVEEGVEAEPFDAAAAAADDDAAADADIGGDLGTANVVVVEMVHV
jgi:hypothetical protein